MSATKLTGNNQVSAFVNNNPDHAIGIFNSLGIDFCCGGAKTLALACEELALDLEQVLGRLNASVPDTHMDKTCDWTRLNLPELTDHIIMVHHKYLQDALPQVEGLIEKVIHAHGGNHPELFALKKAFIALKEDLEPHMMKEENILFPMIHRLEGGLEPETSHCRSVANPIRVMMADHDNVGMLLEEIKTLTDNYSPPEDGCTTYRLLHEKLKEVESDIHLHIHKENNLLFPQALDQSAPG